MKTNTLEKCRDLEYKILQSVGIPAEIVTIKECEIGPSRYIHYVNIHKVPKEKGKILFLCHGYFGSNIAFFKMYKVLKEHFHIISIDLPGKGLSSSEKKTPESIDAWIEYFTSSIYIFLKKIKVEKCHFLGHSLGGFVVSHFLDKYPEMVDMLFLLSPGGMNKENKVFENRIDKRTKEANWFVKCVAKTVEKKIFKDKKSPMDFWFMGMFKGMIMKRAYKGPRLRLSEEEQKLFIPLFTEIASSSPSSEKCLGYLFKKGPMSDRPVIDILKKYHSTKKIFIYYGDSDWIDKNESMQNFKLEKLDVKASIITNSGHQIAYQNPYETANQILAEYFEANLESDDEEEIL